ncbi:MAG: hypothetical protein LBT40_10455 [Deltaproteobacteria bacterium]|jgi:hypothetical protein|nr:hypothetical protein [Deltaproteobacteria bacterium]
MTIKCQFEGRPGLMRFKREVSSGLTGARDSALFVLGMRVRLPLSQILSLKVGSVMDEDRLIRPAIKLPNMRAGGGRELKIDWDVSEELELYLGTRPYVTQDDYLFPSSHNLGKPMVAGTVNTRFKAIAAKMDLSDMGPKPEGKLFCGFLFPKPPKGQDAAAGAPDGDFEDGVGQSWPDTTGEPASFVEPGEHAVFAALGEDASLREHREPASFVEPGKSPGPAMSPKTVGRARADKPTASSRSGKTSGPSRTAKTSASSKSEKTSASSRTVKPSGPSRTGKTSGPSRTVKPSGSSRTVKSGGPSKTGKAGGSGKTGK